MKSANEYIKQFPQELYKREWFRDFRPHFHTLIFEPINRLVASKEDVLIGYILMSCTIEYLAGFWWGESVEVGVIRQAYVGFINTYFYPRGRYNAKGLYDCLRNGLVHTFTIKNKMYELTYDEPEKHLTTGSHDCIVLNAANFRDDLFGAANRYFDHVETDSELLDKAFMRYERDGFIAWVD